jgi:hypothetical protein
MPEVRRADPAARRRAVLAVAAAALVGTALVAGLEHYRTALHDWLVSGPGDRGRRVTLVLVAIGAALSLPLLAFAAYLWSLGARTVGAGEFPPPGLRVIRDTPVVLGQTAVLRGRALMATALVLGAMSALLWLPIWRLARVLRAG